MVNKSIFIFYLIILVACAPKKMSTQSNTGNLHYAKNLRLIYFKNGTKVEIINPKTKKVNYYFLGKDKPLNLKENVNFIQVPIKRIITLSGTDIGMLSKLAAENQIVGVSNKTYVYNQKVKRNCEIGKTISFGDVTAISFEKIIQTKANCLIYSGFENNFPHQKQLALAQIQCVPNYDWKEKHPLGKAEWIRFFGLLLGKEKEANAYFKSCEKAYNNLKNSCDKLKLSKPVLVGNLIGDSWFTPAGENYFSQLLKDSKADYRYQKTKGTESLAYGFEKIMRENLSAFYWINPGYTSLNQLIKTNPKIKYFKSYKENNVFCYAEKMNYFWEMSAIEPQFVLSDLIRILHPEIKQKGTFHFYSKLNE
jgi:iron complex transport system substrate-binding protein